MTTSDIHDRMRKEADTWVEEEQRKRLLFDLEGRRRLRDVGTTVLVLQICGGLFLLAAIGLAVAVLCG